MSMSKKRLWMVLYAGGCMATAGLAADGTWVGSVDGTWNTTANWQGGTVASGAGYVATLSDLAGPIRITNDASGLKLKGLVAEGGTYTVLGLPLTLEGAASGNYGLIANGGTQTFSLPVNINASSQVYVGSGASLTTAGNLDYLGNYRLTKRGAGEWTFCGTCAETNASAFFDVAGGTLRFSSGATFTMRGGTRTNFQVGYGGTDGRVVVDAGGTLNVAAFVLGYDSGANGELILNGGTFTADRTGDFDCSQLARYADSSMCLSNNAVADFARWLNIGCWARGELTIASGSTVTAGRLSLAWMLDPNASMDGSSVVNVSDGTLHVRDQFVWRSSGTSSRTNRVTVGNGHPESGRLVLPATTRLASNQGFARLTLNGGTLAFTGVADATDASLTNYLYGLDQLFVGQVGAVIDTSNLNATVTQKFERDPAFRSDGGITKVGSGCLTLLGGCAYVGPTVVGQGTLRLGGALPTHAVVVLPGAVLSLADGQYGAFAPSSLIVGQGGVSAVELEAGAGNVCDRLTLPADAQLGSVAFVLSGLNGASSYWMPGDYVIATYSAAVPDIGGWTVSLPTGVTASFELQSAQKRVVLHVSGNATGASVWLKPVSGNWSESANWGTLPANDPGTAVCFGDAPGCPTAVGLTAPVTVGAMTFDSPYAYTLAGAGITFGATGADGLMNVAQGGHVLAATLTLPADMTITARPGASLLLGGGATGVGGITVTGGGLLFVTNGLAIDVPVTLNGATLSATDSTTLDTALTVGDAGAGLAPSYGKTLSLAGRVNGGGAIVKSGASVVVMSGANTATGTRTVQNGTLTLTSLTDGGDLVIGEGTLKYTGSAVTTGKGLTLRTSDGKLGATFETDADVTFNGNLTAENGVFIKAGKGTVTFAAAGVNQFGTGMGSDNNYVYMNRGTYGESPTQGLRVFQILDGTVVVGTPGQTNTMNGQTVIVGGESTTAANAETAGRLVINDGVWVSGFITIGRGNGSAITAPTGLVSTVRINGGKVTTAGLWMGQRTGDIATITARPLFEMNGGDFSGAQLFCGNGIGTTRPRLVFNGGFAAFTGSGSSDIRLAYDGGVTSETVVAGGTLAVSNTLIRIADANAAAKGVVRLNGGRLITRGFERLGNGVAELYLNGGVLEPCTSMTLTNLSMAIVQAGGFTVEAADGIMLSVEQPLAHDADLGGTPDGGLLKLGVGTLVLRADQAYTGPTVVSGGVLRVIGALASADMILAGGTTLSLTNGVEQTFAPTAFSAGDALTPAKVELDVAADGSAYDVLALPTGDGVRLIFSLYKTGTSARFTRPGRYPLVTFGGSAPDTSEWSVETLETAASFEAEGSTIYIRIGAGSGSVTPSVWTSPIGGAWSEAGNWSISPANDASASILFGEAITEPATITTGSGATFGCMIVDSAKAYTWNGGALTFGSADSNATAVVSQGSHVMDTDLAVPSAAKIVIGEHAGLAVNGTVTGAGSLTVSGGTLALTDGADVTVPLTFDGVAVTMSQSTVFDVPITLETGGATIKPETGRSVEITSDVTGTGGLTKTGSSILTLSGGIDFAGELTVRNGTVTVAEEPAGMIVIGEATLKYTGATTTFTRGYRVRTTLSSQAATIDSDADITFNGQVTAENGTFLKLGSGTLTYAYGGENILSAGDNQGTGSTALNVQPYGDTPTQGYRSYNVFNGKVVLGAEGQTNVFSQAVVIGGESTLAAGSETAGHMEINGGVNEFKDYITIGRGNGTSNTAPDGVASTLTINGGETTAKGFWMAAMLGNETTLTARPRFILNGGLFSTLNFYCGNSGGTPKPQIEINGGNMTVGPNDAMRLVCSPGCDSELAINGGCVTLTHQSLYVAGNYAGARGVLRLNGGRLVADGLYQEGTNAVAIVCFNGGVFEPSKTATLDGALQLTNSLGGAIFDVPQDITYTLGITLNHDATLGATPDGGLVKLGAGTLAVSAVQAYTGPTVVSNGTLMVIAPTGSAFTTGALSLGGTPDIEVALNLTADRDRFASGGAVAVNGDLYLGKTAVTLVMRETNAAPSTNGVYIVATCTGTISGDAANLRLANPVFGRSYTFSLNGNDLLLTVATDTENAAVWTRAGSGVWADAGNWAAAPGAGASGLAVGFLDAITGPATVTLDAAATAGSLRFDNANGYRIIGSGELTLDETNGVPLLEADQGLHTVTVPIALPENVMAVVSASAELDLTGTLSGEGKLTKTDDGRLLLSGTNTYAGGTDLLRGVLDVSGTCALGTGLLTVNGGHLAGKGSSTATVPNDANVLKPVTLAAYAPLKLSGEWTASGTVVYTKSASNELTIAGGMKNAPGALTRLNLNEGTLRFASGADVYLRNSTADQASRNHINFDSPTAANAVRSLRVESGAKVEIGCMYVGYGATNLISVAGGTLSLQGHAWGGLSDALIMGAKGSVSPVVDRFDVSDGFVYGTNGFWFMMGVNNGYTTLDVSGGAVSLGCFSMGTRAEANNNGDSKSDVFVRGDGLLEARQRWNWMGDLSGTRLNAVYLDGGTLRLPATFASVTNRLNQSRLVFNGGVLQTMGGGLDPEISTDYLRGLKQAHVGPGGAVVDTQGRSVTFAQRLTAQNGVDDGGLIKRGYGTLTLAKPPCVTGVVDVQAGMLTLKPESGVAYPDDPMVRFTFENGVQTDDSAYEKNAGTTTGTTNGLSLIAGVKGTNAVHFAGSNAPYVNYSDDMANMDTYTVSAWVRMPVYQSVNQKKTFFGTLPDYNLTRHAFLLRVMENGDFRMLGAGPFSSVTGYGQLYADVLGAVPENTWVMLTYVADGLNGISMYVNGTNREMRVYNNGAITYTNAYGAGQHWLFQPTANANGRAFAMGAVTVTESNTFSGDLDDVTVYRRALSAAELSMLYRSHVPYGRRVRVAMGANLNLAGVTQEVAEVTGEGTVLDGTASVTHALNPGDAADTPAGALLVFNGGLTLGAHVTYTCDWTPAANDLVDIWGTLGVDGAGTIDLGLTLPSQMPGSPRYKSFPVMYYTSIVGASNFSQWKVSGTGRKVTGSISASDGVVTVNLDVPSGSVFFLR